MTPDVFVSGHGGGRAEATRGDAPADESRRVLSRDVPPIERVRSGRRRHLPLYEARDDHGSNFDALRVKEAALLAEVSALDLAALRRGDLLSANGKTSVSLDFPTGQTCMPTAICAAYCYTVRPNAPVGWEKSLLKRLRNLRYFQLEDVDTVVTRLTREFNRARRRWSSRVKKLDFLRVNGTGDLFPEIIPVLNGFAIRNPDVKLWIVTRKFDLAVGVAALPNVFLQLSLDASTHPALEGRALGLVQTHPRAYLSFLRTAAADDTRRAAIVFNEKRTAGLPYDRRTDCPVDAEEGRLDLGNVRGVGGTACSKCRKCFKEDVIVRQRSLLGLVGNP